MLRCVMPKIVKLSNMLGALLKARGMEGHLNGYRIFGQWEKTVGPAIARHARPLSVRGKRLFLAVDSSAWMQQLSLLKPEIIEKVNRSLGKDAIGDIKLALGEIGAAAMHAQQDAVTGQLTAEERGRIEETVVQIRDADVRQAVRRIMEKDILSKKTRPVLRS